MLVGSVNSQSSRKISVDMSPDIHGGKEKLATRNVKALQVSCLWYHIVLL